MKNAPLLGPWACLLVMLSVQSYATGPSATKPASDKVTIKLAMAAGQVWAFDQTYDGSADTKATVRGQPQTINTKIHRHRSGKVEVLSVANEKPTLMRLTFGADCDGTFETTGQAPQKVPFPYAGKTVMLTRQLDGTIRDDFTGQVEAADQGELHAQMDPDTSIYPAEPKAVGDEWAGDPAALAKMFPAADPHDQAGMSIKFLKLEVLNGRPVADLLVTVSAFKEQQNVTTKLDSKTAIQVDLLTGHPVRIDMKGTTNDSGDQSTVGADGQPITYHESNGTIAMLVVSDLSGVLPAVIPPSSLPGVAPAATASFTGQYSDGKLTLDLNEVNGKYVGSITLAKKFPAAAAVRAGVLEGTFESDGYSYPFTATINGSIVTLTSGGATYVLKKAN